MADIKEKNGMLKHGETLWKCAHDSKLLIREEKNLVSLQPVVVCVCVFCVLVYIASVGRVNNSATASICSITSTPLTLVFSPWGGCIAAISLSSSDTSSLGV